MDLCNQNYISSSRDYKDDFKPKLFKLLPYTRTLKDRHYFKETRSLYVGVDKVDAMVIAFVKGELINPGDLISIPSIIEKDNIIALDVALYDTEKFIIAFAYASGLVRMMRCDAKAKTAQFVGGVNTSVPGNIEELILDITTESKSLQIKSCEQEFFWYDSFNLQKLFT